MRRVVGFLHAAGRQVRVDLRRAQALVAEQLLHAAQVGAVVQQVRREAVTQRVRADPGIEAGLHEVFVELAAHRAGAERFAVLVEEDASLVGALALGAAGGLSSVAAPL